MLSVRSLASHCHIAGLPRRSASAVGWKEANEALEKAIEISPASFDMYVRDRVRFMRPEDHTHMLEGLRKAGWRG